MEVGGRNYIDTSKVESYASYNTTPKYDGETNEFSSTMRYDNSSIYRVFTLAVSDFIPEKNFYTVSGYMSVNGEPANEDYFWDKRATTYSKNTSRFEIKSETGKFIISQEHTGESRWIFHAFLDINYVHVGDIITLKDLQFEKGQVVSDWKPSFVDAKLSTLQLPHNCVIVSDDSFLPSKYLTKAGQSIHVVFSGAAVTTQYFSGKIASQVTGHVYLLSSTVFFYVLQETSGYRTYAIRTGANPNDVISCYRYDGTAI